MDMPTVCTCGELVEFDNMKAIGNKLYCEDCYEEWSRNVKASSEENVIRF